MGVAMTGRDRPVRPLFLLTLILSQQMSAKHKRAPGAVSRSFISMKCKLGVFTVLGQHNTFPLTQAQVLGIFAKLTNAYDVLQQVCQFLVLKQNSILFLLSKHE